MKLVSFNANGIRSRMHQLQALKERLDPDIIGVQEIKVQDAGFPLAEVESLGYHVEHFGQKSHYGVALLSKTKPLSVTKGFPFETEDDQRRLITAVYEPVPGQRLTVINGYFPQGESRDHPVKFPNKTRFYAGLKRYLSESFDPKESLVVMGDMNVAPQDKDIGIGPDNAKRWLKTGKCSFLPEEREWVNALMDWGLTDTYRCRYPDEDSRFSWFDYRSRGFEREPRRGLRIDLLLATAPLIERCVDAGIDYEIRSMDKPSDHCPVWAAFEL